MDALAILNRDANKCPIRWNRHFLRSFDRIILDLRDFTDKVSPRFLHEALFLLRNHQMHFLFFSLLSHASIFLSYFDFFIGYAQSSIQRFGTTLIILRFFLLFDLILEPGKHGLPLFNQHFHVFVRVNGQAAVDDFIEVCNSHLMPTLIRPLQFLLRTERKIRLKYPLARKSGNICERFSVENVDGVATGDHQKVGSEEDSYDWHGEVDAGEEFFGLVLDYDWDSCRIKICRGVKCRPHRIQQRSFLLTKSDTPNPLQQRTDNMGLILIRQYRHFIDPLLRTY